MIDNSFRERLPAFVAPLIRVYAWAGVSPNGLSVCALLLAVFAAWLCANDFLWGAISVWWLGRLLDGTDGIYARAVDKVSDFGAYLDIVCDMAAYSVMVLGLQVRFPEEQPLWSYIVVLYVLCVASALALGSLEQKRNLSPRDNRSLRLGAGLAEGGETGIAYTLFLLFPEHLSWLCLLWIGALVFTVVARTLLAQRLLALPQSTKPVGDK